MIKFNELRITPDNQYLIIDVSIEDNVYYENVVLDKIVIDTQDTYIDSGPSDSPVYTLDAIANKNIRLVLSYKDLNTSLNDNMFFIYAVATGTPAPDTPCGLDNSILKNAVINLYPIYLEAIKYIKELNCDCSIPKEFINIILRYQALELCIKTGNYILAIKYWKKFLLGINPSSTYKCKCNGTTI